jgi:large subunit ribosomal protein L27e
LLHKNCNFKSPLTFSLKPGKAVILLQGKYAGHKAVIVKNFDEKSKKEREYGHCIVAGIARYPKKALKKYNLSKLALKSRLKPFLKLVNHTHIMPTRYTVDIDFKNVQVTQKTLKEPSKKRPSCRKVKRIMEERYLSGKNKWFFTKLKF